MGQGDSFDTVATALARQHEALNTLQKLQVRLIFAHRKGDVDRVGTLCKTLAVAGGKAALDPSFNGALNGLIVATNYSRIDEAMLHVGQMEGIVSDHVKGSHTQKLSDRQNAENKNSLFR